MIVTKLQEFIGHVDCIYSATLQHSQQQVFTAGGDGIVAAWNYTMESDGVMQVKVKNSIYSMCLFQNKLLLGGSTGNLYVVDLATKSEERNIEAHQQGIFDIIYDEANHRIFTCGFDGVFNVWSEKFELLYAYKLSDKSLRNICVMPGLIAIAASDFAIYLLDNQNFKIVQKLEHHSNSVFALAYNPNTSELLSGGRDCYLKIWDTKTWNLKQEYVGATLHINHIVFNPDFSMYALSSMDKTLKIFDANTHEALKFIDKVKYDGHTSSVNKALWLDNQKVISISDDKKAIAWELK